MLRIGTIVLISLSLTPLWAEDDDINNRDFEIGALFEDEIITPYFFDQIFLFELSYNLETEMTNRVRFSWPVLRDWRSPWRFILEIQPGIWENQRSKMSGDDPIQPEEFYAGIHFLKEKNDIRLLAPLAISSDGRKLDPFLDIRRIHIMQIDDKTELFGHGFISQSSTDFDFGVCRKLGSFQARVDFDLDWSVEFRTSMNTPLN